MFELVRSPVFGVDAVDPLVDPRWAELTREHGSLFTSPPWLRALAETYGFEMSALLALDPHGEPIGGLPLVRLGAGEESRLSALPFSDYCTPIDVDGTGWPLLHQSLLDEGVPFEIRVLGPDPIGDDHRLIAGSVALWHGIDLDPDPDRSWAALAGSARRAIRKARDAGVEVRAVNDLVAVRAFYDLHLGVRKHKYGLLPQPFSFFEALHRCFGDALTLLGAWREGDLVAGVLYLQWGDTLYYKFNASSPAALECRPNDLLMWEGMRHAVSLGLQRVDLGRTDADHDSLARYKAKYATSAATITTLRHGDIPRHPLVGELLGPLTQLLTRADVPDEITEASAEIIYRYFA